jgi:hypothetical protein
VGFFFASSVKVQMTFKASHTKRRKLPVKAGVVNKKTVIKLLNMTISTNNGTHELPDYSVTCRLL